MHTNRFIKFSPDSHSEKKSLKIGQYLVKLRRTKMVPFLGHLCIYRPIHLQTCISSY